MATEIRVRGLSRRGFRVSSTKRVNYAQSTLVDLDNYPDARLLSAHQGDYYTVPEQVMTYNDLLVKNENLVQFTAPRDGTIFWFGAMISGTFTDTDVSIFVNNVLTGVLTLNPTDYGRLDFGAEGLPVSEGDVITASVTDDDGDAYSFALGFA